MSVSENLAAVRRRIIAASDRANRDPASVRLVAVTKQASVTAIGELLELGHRDLGENRPQQLLERASLFSAHAPQWHLIGSLQRNKARKVLPATALIHSIDSFRLLDAVDRLADELQRRPRILLEVNVSGEDTKQGFTAAELRDGLARIVACRRLDPVGLMTMAPYAPNPENARLHFRALRTLRDELAAAGPLALPELSMGMSGDFDVAIEEGATIVRVGSALFESAT